MTHLRRLPVAIVGRRNIVGDVIEVLVARPPDFVFAAGQHVQIEVDKLHQRDQRGTSRVFSLSSSPHDTDVLSFAFRRSDSGFKQTLERLSIGSRVRISGPYGHVTLTDESRRPRILLAHGVGITPYISMARFAAESMLSVPLTVLYSVVSRAHAAYLSELQVCANANPSMTLQLRTGALSSNDLSQARREWPDAVWYLSGPPTRVHHLSLALRDIGVPDDDVVSEEFIGY